jgi:hypothetical protein
MGSCITFPIPKSIAEELAILPQEIPERNFAIAPISGSIASITKSEARTALKFGSFYFVNIPIAPDPFVSVWTMMDIGEKCALDNSQVDAGDSQRVRAQTSSF